jgi:hypothetical protein
MTIDELYSHLCKTGYRALLRRFASGFSLLDYDIEREDSVVRICERERGQIIHSYLETPDEAAACAQYLERVSSQFQFLLGDANEAIVMSHQKRLEDAGITVRRSVLPEYLGLKDSRYRLSVAGADLKRSQELLGL